MGKYFGLGEDWDQLTGKFNSGGERTMAGFKLIGKSLFNAGTYAVTEAIPGVIEQGGKKTSDYLEKNRSSMSSEQIEQAEKVIKNGEKMAQKRNQSGNK